jgi:uncharacterized protein (DUF1697 family)
MVEKYIAFLRGINLGKRRVKNDQLVQVFTALGFREIKVLIASGNVVFTTDDSDEIRVTSTVEAALQDALGFKIDTMLRTADEIRAMLTADPFAEITMTKATRLYVTLLAEPTTSTLPLPYATDDGNFRILSRTDREVYSVLTVADGGRTVDLMAIIEKEYGKRATTRNWNTIVKAAAL